MHGNKREVEKAVEFCRCLFQVSGNTCYPMHDFYRSVCYSVMMTSVICVVRMFTEGVTNNTTGKVQLNMIHLNCHT